MNIAPRPAGLRLVADAAHDRLDERVEPSRGLIDAEKISRLAIQALKTQPEEFADALAAR